MTVYKIEDRDNIFWYVGATAQEAFDAYVQDLKGEPISAGIRISTLTDDHELSIYLEDFPEGAEVPEGASVKASFGTYYLRAKAAAWAAWNGAGFLASTEV